MPRRASVTSTGRVPKWALASVTDVHGRARLSREVAWYVVRVSTAEGEQVHRTKDLREARRLLVTLGSDSPLTSPPL